MKMRIGLIGCGRMGRELEQLAPTLGMELCVRFDLGNELADSSDLQGAQVLIDFSTAGAVIPNLTVAAQKSIPVVEGTTGWLSHMEQIRAIPGLTMIYSSNFSMGVYRFQQLVKLAGQLLGSSEMYDAYVHEWHHNAKADSPSGTALTLARTLLSVMPQKKELLTNASEGKISPQALHVTSTRVGRVPGTHEIGFDSQFDQITLRHQAFGREAFAYGALAAVTWIADRKGIYTMDDFMTQQQ
jgi:4-hydroxy-tetrahydrodipicolinate reductase